MHFLRHLYMQQAYFSDCYFTTFSSSSCVFIWTITTIIITITHITDVDATKIMPTLKVTLCTAWRSCVIGLGYTVVALHNMPITTYTHSAIWNSQTQFWAAIVLIWTSIWTCFNIQQRLKRCTNAYILMSVNLHTEGNLDNTLESPVNQVSFDQNHIIYE